MTLRIQLTRAMPNDQDRVTKQPNPIYTYAAEETDTRLWYHVETTCTNILAMVYTDQPQMTQAVGRSWTITVSCAYMFGLT